MAIATKQETQLLALHINRYLVTGGPLALDDGS